jgi:two-component system chemotaxis response regulator CheB
MTERLQNQQEPWLITIAASAGGIPAIRQILAELPAGLPAAIVIVQHRSPSKTSMLEQILARSSRLPVVEAKANDRIASGVVYLARPDLHLSIGPNKEFVYHDGTPIRHVFSSANPLFESAAKVFGRRVIGVVLTGSGRDGTDGVQAIRAFGGTVIAQDPGTSHYPDMPLAAIREGGADRIVPLDAIAKVLADIIAAG